MKLGMRLTRFFLARFNALLILIVLLLLTAPLLRQGNGEDVFLFFYGLVFLVSNVLMLRIMIEHNARFLALASFFALVFIFDIATKRSGVDWPSGVLILADSIYAAFLILFLRNLFRSLFTEKKVTSNSIKGGICIYLLFGVLWGLLYRLLFLLDPSAFNSQTETLENLFYFSFVTLTTLGYGDIVPVSAPAQTLAFMEAVTGQVFLAVFIARLMGLHIAHVMRRTSEQA